MAETTKAPTGLKITRSGNKFTAEWKIADADYGDGQYLQYLINDTGKDSWKDLSIGKTTSKKVIATIDKSNFYPNNGQHLFEIGVRVKGNRKKYTTGSGRNKKTHNPGTSGWTEKRFTVNAPKKPSITAALDSELTNVCTFTWSAPYASDDSYIFTNVQWQTILVQNSSESDGSKLSWNGSTFEEGSSTANNSRTITEDTSILYRNGNSYTRWFRVRARGPRGASEWRYAKHVYALTHQTNVTGVSAGETEDGGFQCVVDWSVGDSDGQNPIDKTIAQYAITIPAEGLTCPSGVSWIDANISKDTSGGDTAVFSVDDQLGKDQCLFIRVNTQHDNNITHGIPQLAKVGYLKDPSGLSVSTDDTTHRATITATNNSDVQDSMLIVKYVPASGNSMDVGVIPHGSTSVTVQCPDWSSETAISFSVYAIVGTATKQTRADNIDSYSVNAKMRSQGTISQGGTVPVAPGNITVNRVEGKSDTVRVAWDWPWSDAGSAEISWSDHDDAWESTDEPESYIISNLHASHWNISGLETGKTWYVRVRLISGNLTNSEGVTYGPWSDINQGTIDLSSAPNKPVLMLSDSVIPEDGSTVASWVYVTTDKTAQAYAEVAIVNNGVYTPIAHSLTAQHVTIPANSEYYSFSTGNIYNLVCRVKSASGKLSEWSEIVSLTIAEPLVCEIAQTSLVDETLDEVAVKSLKEMPLTLTVTGAGDGGMTTVVVERAEDYQLDRPDENNLNGYAGDVVLRTSPPLIGEGQISFSVDDLIGTMDDGVAYNIIATVQDGLGQKAEAALKFEVHWSHQASKPSAKIKIDEEALIATIKPIAPMGAIATDVADIYRLSIDKPELIVQGAEFGETYVDPYPALGEMGGYRIVTRTQNGDYITSENQIAMVDSPELGVNPIKNEEQLNIIDFEGHQIRFYYDTDYSNTWAKDSQETQYLGGSVQIDWNPAVSRTGTLSTKAITVLDQEMLKDVRRLAVYPGLCHVRTADGSSYAADIQVSEDRVHDEQEMVANYSLSITRTDSQGFEGMTLQQWKDSR